MGLLDTLGGLFGKNRRSSSVAGAGGLGGLGSLLGGLGGNGGAMLTALLPMLMGGGLSGILGKLQSSGQPSKVSSWVSTGPNEPIHPDEVEQVLGHDQVAQIAQQAGVSHDEAKAGLSQLLPGVVDHLSPNGKLPEGGGLDDALGKLKGLLG
jgi:uncharacterized protein YidB (DUF937 family)